jgi:LmbE family N-acetylglucosaminyl deacetylase
VLAPHPDDEVLLAYGVLKQAVADGKKVAVVLVTNGDFTCKRDGSVRQRETVAALSSLGIAESSVRFLGYPDGWLSELGEAPAVGVQRLEPDGGCVEATATWADRGAGQVEAHQLRTGQHAPFTAAALTEDLAALLLRLQPRDIYLPHPIDSHRDHASTYVFLRRALDTLLGAPPVLHRALVHAGPCWPGDCAAPPYAPGEAMPALPPPLEGYRPAEKHPIDAQGKLAAIALYASQNSTPAQVDWLAGFARTDEVFFPERLRRDGRVARWVRAGQGPAVTVTLSLESGEAQLALAPDGEPPRPVVRTEGQPLPVPASQRYALARAPGALTLSRLGDGGARELLRSWPLPKGELPASVELRVDPRPDEGITELSLWREGAFFGVQVLPGLHPLR